MKLPSTPSDDARVGIIVATYGDDDWRYTGRLAAEESKQDDDNTRFNVYHCIADVSLGTARNIAAKQLQPDWPYEWLIFLDADDHLPPDYVTRMREGWGDIRQPLTRGYYSNGEVDPEAIRIPRRKLIVSNFIVIGAMCSAAHFWAVQGFRSQPVLEDWDLWLRMYCYVGAEIGQSEAVYDVGFAEEETRNLSPEHAKYYYQIRNQHLMAFRGRGWNNT